VPAAAVQAALRRLFGCWGRPERIRTDNGGPWGSTAGLPTVFELWLVGLGIDLVLNTPRRPQENGVIEQAQGVGKRWAEPGHCDSAEQLQQRIGEEDRLQRHEYPYQDGRSRWEVFPELLHSGRGYSLGWENTCWDLERVLEHLSGYQVPRKVNKQGKVSIYEWDRKVGVAYAGQRVWVAFSPATQEWRMLDGAKAEIRRRPAPEINPEDIVNLRISRAKRQRDPRPKPGEEAEVA
jgi:transposase InsO family protein